MKLAHQWRINISESTRTEDVLMEVFLFWRCACIDKDKVRHFHNHPALNQIVMNTHQVYSPSSVRQTPQNDLMKLYYRELD